MLRGQLLPWTVLAVRYHSPDLSISFKNFIPIPARLTPTVCWGLPRIWSELRTTHEFTVSNAFQLEESRTFLTIIDLYVTTSEIKLKIINLISLDVIIFVLIKRWGLKTTWLQYHRLEQHWSPQAVMIQLQKAAIPLHWFLCNLFLGHAAPLLKRHSLYRFSA